MVPSRPHGGRSSRSRPRRARGFTWDNTPSGTLEVMQRTLEAERPRLRDALRRSESGKAAGLGAAIAVSVLLRAQIAAAIGVDEAPWGAAAILPTGVLWMLISLQRGALQGLRAYAPVGASIVLEGLGRLVCALVLVGAGLDVTGAMLGTPMAFALVAIGLEVALHRRIGPVRWTAGAVRSLRGLLGDGWVPIVG